MSGLETLEIAEEIWRHFPFVVVCVSIVWCEKDKGW